MSCGNDIAIASSRNSLLGWGEPTLWSLYVMGDVEKHAEPNKPCFPLWPGAREELWASSEDRAHFLPATLLYQGGKNPKSSGGGALIYCPVCPGYRGQRVWVGIPSPHLLLVMTFLWTCFWSDPVPRAIFFSGSQWRLRLSSCPYKPLSSHLPWYTEQSFLQWRLWDTMAMCTMSNKEKKNNFGNLNNEKWLYFEKQKIIPPQIT